MSLIVKIVISVVIAAIASGITVWLGGNGHAFPILLLAFCGATISTALLVSFSSGNSAPAAGKRKSRPQHQAPAKAASSAAGNTGREGAREYGEVKWFNVSKGFGFITKDDGEEIFVHFRSIVGGGRRGLKDGQRVSFVVANSDKGPEAEDVEGL